MKMSSSRELLNDSTKLSDSKIIVNSHHKRNLTIDHNKISETTESLTTSNKLKVKYASLNLDELTPKTLLHSNFNAFSTRVSHIPSDQDSSKIRFMPRSIAYNQNMMRNLEKFIHKREKYPAKNFSMFEINKIIKNSIF